MLHSMMERYYDLALLAELELAQSHNISNLYPETRLAKSRDV
jgi:hypothetical protein